MHTFNESGTGVPAFLAKLWRLVEDPKTDNLIYWNRDGRSFIIQNQAQFARELLPMNYKHNNMASFIRQLNMYGFHKITSIENGGLKFDRDDMEFSHPCFKRGCPFLLEHIKRKIATAKTTVEEKATIKPEAVSKVLNEVKVMRGRQESLDTRFSAMKQENEALWREIAVLRQKHLKQQQIVNKLIQFLVTIVQPSRNMSGVKRHFQLMINDVPQTAKVRKRNDEGNSGPVIRELTEELLDEVAESDADLMMNSPHVMSPSDSSHIDFSEDTPRPQSNLSSISSQPESIHGEDYLSSSNCNVARSVTADPDNPSIVYHITELPEDLDLSANHNYVEQNLPTAKGSSIRSNLHRERKRKHADSEAVQPQSQQLQNRRTTSRTGPQSSRISATAMDNSVLNIKKEKDVDPLSYFEASQNQTPIDPDLMSVLRNNATPQPTTSNANNDKQMYISKEDFISNEMPTDLFAENSPMLGDINLSSGSYNENFDFTKSKSGNSSSGASSSSNGNTRSDLTKQRQNLAIAKYNNEDIVRLNTPQDITNHLDNTQEDLDSLKDLLRGEGYTFDANTLLGNSTPANRLILPPSLDGDMLAKLFSDSDILAPYGLSLPPEQQNQEANKKGSELMTYQPCYSGDLSDMLNFDSDPILKDSGYDEERNAANDSVLNTPMPERD